MNLREFINKLEELAANGSELHDVEDEITATLCGEPYAVLEAGIVVIP